MKATVKNIIVLGYVASVLALLGMAWLVYRTTADYLAAQNRVTHTYQVMATLEKGRAILTDTETAQRGYLLTGDDRFREDSANAQVQVRGCLARLRQLTADNAAQQQQLNQLASLISRRLALLNSRIELRREKGLQAVADAGVLREGEQLADRIWRSLSQMHAAENLSLQRWERAARERARFAQTAIVSGAALACVVGLLATLFAQRDLRLRARAEAEVESAKSLLESILDNTPAVVFLKDTAGRYLFVNQRFAQLAGRAREEIMGKSGFELFRRDLALAAEEHDRAVLASGGAQQFEEAVVYPDGPHTHLAVKFPLRDASGNIYAVGGVSADISGHKRAEEALRQSEERARLMVESVKDYAIFMLDPAGQVMTWNAGAQRIKGYVAGEIVGQHFSRFYPEEAVRSGAPEHALATAAREGQFEEEDWRLRRDGSRFWANVLITAMRDLEGRLLGFVKVTRDLTEHRRAEQIREERDRFFELSPDLICVASFDGYFKTLNPAWEHTLGYARAELLARPFLDFVHPDDRAATQAEAAKLTQGGETVNFENRYRCQDGSYRWLAWNSLGVRPQQLVYATARDTTAHKQNQQKILQLNADLQRHAGQLETANKELEAFSYSVSHDLRAPLRHIDGFVGLLAKQSAGKLDDRGRRYLGIIADSAKRMGALIDDLLIFSRMGRAELRCSIVAPASLVHETVDALEGEIGGRRIVWKLGKLPQVEADPAMLRQVWTNLIANAVKYTRSRDPAEIEIDCDERDGEFVFHVRDNGVGFDMQYAHKLFGVFQRLHRDEDFEGTGIGLANVQRIVRRHGGRTWAEGKVGGGATFFFSLPKHQTPTETKG